ncbi:MAG: CopD family protein [Bacteroidetes bacterium]|nr:CopD family protein [Bacteroidota bacterium]
MMKWLLLVHVLGASVWVGGHLILLFTVVPRARKQQSIRPIMEFEESFSPLGLTSLALQVISGVWMALHYVSFSDWFDFSYSHQYYLWIKLSLLAATVAIAIRTKFSLLKQPTDQDLPAVVFHIALVTMLAVGFVVTGISFRYPF